MPKAASTSFGAHGVHEVDETGLRMIRGGGMVLAGRRCLTEDLREGADQGRLFSSSPDEDPPAGRRVGHRDVDEAGPGAEVRGLGGDHRFGLSRSDRGEQFLPGGHLGPPYRAAGGGVGDAVSAQVSLVSVPG
jgi:hypothetical protein